MVLVEAKCQCGEIKVKTDVDSKQLPLPTALCHCTLCRFASGQLVTSWATVPHGTGVDVSGEPGKVSISEHCEHLFCKDCGTNLVMRRKDGSNASLAAGAVVDGSQVETKMNIFVGSTIDGGAREWLQPYTSYVKRDEAKGDEKPLEIPHGTTWPVFAQELYMDTKKLGAVSFRQGERASNKDVLTGFCFCGGVELRITRPTHDKYNFEAVEGFEHFVKDRKDRYPAMVCGCHDCRESSGHELQAWALIPNLNLIDATTGKHLDPQNIPCVSRFSRTPNNYRYFCTKCGATCFMTLGVFDNVTAVSAGLLDSAEGVLAEDWLEWAPHPYLPDGIRNKKLQSTLKAGMKEFFASD